MTLFDSTLEAAEAVEPLKDLTNFFGSMSSDQLIEWVTSTVISVGSKLLLAVVIYVIGAWVIGRIVKVMQRMFDSKGVDVSLGSFLVSLVRIVLMIILVFTIVGVLGINTSSFLALFASAGLAVGMALSGTLQNFAGGVLILFLRPFKVGDFIEAQGFSGTVKEISLFSTLLNTLDNKTIIIPNGPLSNNSVNNYSKESTRCVSWTFGVAYGSDIEQVSAIINELLDNNEFVLQDSARVVELTALSSSSVDMVVKAWCRAENYWALYHSMNRRTYDTFNAKGVVFPFSQLDVNLKSEK